MPNTHPIANIENQIQDVTERLAHAYEAEHVNFAEIQDLEFELENLHNALDASSMSIYR